MITSVNDKKIVYERKENERDKIEREVEERKRKCTKGRKMNGKKKIVYERKENEREEKETVRKEGK